MFQPLSSGLSVSYLEPLVEQQTVFCLKYSYYLSKSWTGHEWKEDHQNWNKTTQQPPSMKGWESGWEKLSCCCCCCCCGLFSNTEGMSLFLSCHLLSHGNLWLQKAVMQTEYKGNILSIAETGHMLQSDVQELGKHEQGSFVCSIKGSIGLHFEEHKRGQYCLLIFSQFVCLKVHGQLKGVLTL